jgi:hypothetical protein
MPQIGRSTLVLAAVLIAACSSDNDGDGAPSCTIEGTYSMTAAIESQSEGCSDIQAGPPSVVTITARPSGNFLVELQGGTGGCAGDLVGTCKVQTKCDVRVSDATDPSNNMGTLQFSWTFDANGFTGLNSAALPPARSLPRGCTFTSNATATRR